MKLSVIQDGRHLWASSSLWWLGEKRIKTSYYNFLVFHPGCTEWCSRRITHPCWGPFHSWLGGFNFDKCHFSPLPTFRQSFQKPLIRLLKSNQPSMKPIHLPPSGNKSFAGLKHLFNREIPDLIFNIKMLWVKFAGPVFGFKIYLQRFKQNSDEVRVTLTCANSAPPPSSSSFSLKSIFFSLLILTMVAVP